MDNVDKKKEHSAISNPHDKFFKENFSDPKDLIPLIKLSLPESKRKVLDLSTLCQIDATFTTEALNEYYADLVFDCKMANDYGDATVCILLEHKSAPDDMIFIQLLLYMSLMWNKFRKSRTTIKEIPAIIPIVVYTGNQKSHIKTLREIFSDSPLKEYYPDFKFEFLSIADCDEDEIKKLLPDSVPLYFWNMLLKQNLKSYELIDALIDVEKRVPDMNYLKKHFKSLIAYIESTNKTLANSLMNSRKEEKYMQSGLLDALRNDGIEIGLAKGRIEGRNEGRIEGRNEGKIEGKNEVIRNLMKNLGFSREQAIDAMGIPASERAYYMSNSNIGLS